VLAQEDLPAVGLREARDASEEGGLAGTAGAEYRNDLARRHLEGYIVEHDTVAKPLAQSDDAYCRIGCQRGGHTSFRRSQALN
jgi:hypothetical protein